MNNALKIFFVCLMLISPIIAGGGGETNKELDPVYEAISHVADSMKITKVGNSYEAGEISALFTLPKILQTPSSLFCLILSRTNFV